MKTEIKATERGQPEIIKTSDASYRKIAYREMLWFILSFVGFYSMAIIFTGMGWLYLRNSPFGILSLLAYGFCVLGACGFFRSIEWAKKRIKIRLAGKRFKSRGGIKNDRSL